MAVKLSIRGDEQPKPRGDAVVAVEVWLDSDGTPPGSVTLKASRKDGSGHVANVATLYQEGWLRVWNDSDVGKAGFLCHEGHMRIEVRDMRGVLCHK